jgi:hypothetical protein
MASWNTTPDKPSLLDITLAAHLDRLGIEWGSQGFQAAREAIHAVNHGNPERAIRSERITLAADEVCIALRLEPFITPNRWTECEQRRSAA